MEQCVYIPDIEDMRFWLRLKTTAEEAEKLRKAEQPQPSKKSESK